jgi:transposase
MNELLKKLIVYHQIHKMHRDGWKISRIASFLVINRRTVNKYLAMSEEDFIAFQESVKNRKKELAPYEGFVKIKLEKYPQTSAAQMHDWLKEHYDHFPEVSSKTVYNFVMWVRQQHNIPKTGDHRDYCIVEELPYGKQAQVDFGEYNMRDGQGKRVKVYFFTIVLSRSRYKWVYFSQAPFTTSLAIVAHYKAFEFFGGIVSEIVYDQDRVFMVDENKGDLILTEEFQTFCKAMPFKLYFCRKSDPQSKGKIENVVKYVKQNFLYNRPFTDIHTLNREALSWLSRTANGMHHKVTKKKPSDEWMIEQEHLIDLVPYSFKLPEKTYPVRSDNAVNYMSNTYSVPEGTYKKQGTEVTILTQDGQLIIRDLSGNHLCTHDICWDKGRTIVNTDHRRDKSQTVDNLLMDVAMTFPEYDKAQVYLERIRKAKTRYARDQFQHIRQCVARADPDSVTKALKYCLDNDVNSATDFEAIMDNYMKERKASGQSGSSVARQAPVSINKKIVEIIPNTSSILDYEKIMKN